MILKKSDQNTLQKNTKFLLILDRINDCMLVVGIFFLFYSLYKSQIFNLDENLNEKYIKYIVTFFILIFFFSLIKISKNHIKYGLIISAFSTVLILYLLEILCTFVFNNRFTVGNNYEKIKKEYYLKKNNIAPIYSSYEERKRLASLGKLDNNTEIMHVIRNEDVKYENIFPLSGQSKKKIIFCNETDRFVTYNSDRYGFNNDDTIWDKDIEVVTLGDSFTHGACVESHETISANLNSLAIRSLNLGYSGNGSLKTFGALKEYGEKISSVKHFVWFYFEGNDLDELQNEIQSEFLKPYLHDADYSQGLISEQVEIDRLHDKIIEKKISNYTKKISKQNINFSSKLKEFFKLYNLRISLNIDGPFIIREDTIKNLETILINAKETTQNLGAKFTIVYLPSYLRYKKTLTLKENLHQKNKILKLFKKNNIQFLDIDEIYFKKLDDPLSAVPLRLQGHYTAEVYKDIAKIVATKLNLIK